MIIGIIGSVLLIFGMFLIKDNSDDKEYTKELSDAISELNEALYSLTGKKDSGTKFAEWLEKTFFKVYSLGLILCLVQIAINIYYMM